MTDLLTELRSITDALDVARVDYALCGGARQRAGPGRHQEADGADGVNVDMSAHAVTVRLQRLSQLRALCLSLAAAGRRAGLAPHPAGSPPESDARLPGAAAAGTGAERGGVSAAAWEGAGGRHAGAGERGTGAGAAADRARAAVPRSGDRTGLAEPCGNRRGAASGGGARRAGSGSPPAGSGSPPAGSGRPRAAAEARVAELEALLSRERGSAPDQSDQ